MFKAASFRPGRSAAVESLASRDGFVKACRALGILILATGFSLLSPSAHALLIENGMYWDPRDSGRGYLIEHQNGQVAMAYYEIEEASGQPVFYVGAGPLLTHAYGLLDYDLMPRDIDSGLLPTHWTNLILMRQSRNEAGELVAEPAFQVYLYFIYGKSPWIVVEPVPTEAEPFPDRRPHFLTKFSFGREIFGARTSDGSPDRFRKSTWLTDLGGDWVFVDQLDPTLEARRFRFEFVSHVVEPSSSGVPGLPFTVVYRDDQRSAVMTCRTSYVQVFPETDIRSGCQLDVNGEALYAFNHWDVGVFRMEGYRGALPPHSEPVDRRPERVIGVRVELPTVVH